MRLRATGASQRAGVRGWRHLRWWSETPLLPQPEICQWLDGTFASLGGLEGGWSLRNTSALHETRSASSDDPRGCERVKSLSTSLFLNDKTLSKKILKWL